MNDNISVRSNKTDITPAEKLFRFIKSFSDKKMTSPHLKNMGIGITKKVLFLLLILASYLLQFNFIPRSSFPVAVYLLIPLTVAISMFEYEFSGLIFGLLAGALWDLASPLPDGIMAFSLALAALVTGLLCHYILRNTLLSSLIINSVLCGAYSFFTELLLTDGLDFSEFQSIFIKFYLPPAVIAIIISIPIYLLIRKISLKFKN